MTQQADLSIPAALDRLQFGILSESDESTSGFTTESSDFIDYISNKSIPETSNEGKFKPTQILKKVQFKADITYHHYEFGPICKKKNLGARLTKYLKSFHL